jgi:hypothetical protein
MSPSRRQVVSAIAAGTVVPTSAAVVSGSAGSEPGFSPELAIGPNHLVATVGERDGDVDPDTVTVHTADGTVHEFDGAAEYEWEAGGAFEVGYTAGDSRGRIEGWHGVVERVTATKDEETVTLENDADSTLEVSCSLWRTPDLSPKQFTVRSDGAEKHHWNRDVDELPEAHRRYGSPGRELRTVAERHHEHEMRVDFGDRDCDPEAERALQFEGTSVTVEPAELNQGESRIEDARLGFVDGTHESLDGNADPEVSNGAFELPATLEGTGDNREKVVESLDFKVPGGEYYYWNTDAEAETEGASSETGTETGTPDEGSTPTEASGDGGSDGGSSSGGTRTEKTSTRARTDGGTESSTRTRATGTAEPTATPVDGDSGTATPSDTATPTPGAAGSSGDRELSGAEVAEEQTGMGVLTALGGLLGVGELARRGIGRDGNE